MAGYKTDRLNEDILRELTAIMREMKDPRISDNMLSVVRTELSPDQSHCKVFVSSLAGINKAKSASVALSKASGYVRHELMSRLEMRKCPELHFVADDSIEYSSKINTILNNLSIPRDDDSNEDKD